MKGQPAKPRLPVKVVECGPGQWDEQDHGLDYPAPFHTTNFRVTGRGHERIDINRPRITDAARLGPAFDLLWPPEDTSQFGRLIRAIDEALVRSPCQARLHRFHRTLERNYRI